MTGSEINWARWLLYLMVGVPLLVWLFGTKNNALRLAAVVATLIVIQDTFAGRRYVVAVGFGPSLMLCYVALLGLYFQRGRFPSLGASAGLWAFLLLAAASGAMVGSFGTGLLFFEIRAVQELYLEGLLFFILGVMALPTDADVRRFFFWYLLAAAFPVALLHLYGLLTGWRPENFVLAGQADRIFYGAVFINPNTLAAFYSMVIPVGILMLMRERMARFERALLLGVLVVMSVSLLLTQARGGLLFTALLSVVALLLSGLSLGRILQAGVLAGLLFFCVRFVATDLFPEVFGLATEKFEAEGLDTDRFKTWSTFLRLIAEHPVGIGLLPENTMRYQAEYQTNLTSAHNIYLDQAMKMGIHGMVAFVLLVGYIAMRNLRAISVSRKDPDRKRALSYALLAIAGFLLSGMTEPIYNSTAKMNATFWVLAGVGYAASSRAFLEVPGVASVRAPRLAAPAQRFGHG